MKLFFYIILIASLLMSCSNDDDVTTFSPRSISFIYSNGISLSADDCIDPNAQYAILIDVNAVGNGPSVPTKVEFTVNGAVFSTTFTDRQAKSIPIAIKEGVNIAELVKSGVSSTVYVVLQDDFELVE